MSIHNGHRNRIKQKFLEHGFQGFHPHEILEFLLFYSTPRRDTNPIAHELIEHYGDISSVFDAPFEELIKIKGVTENSATLIKSIPYFSRVYLESSHKNFILDSTDACGKYLIPKFIGRTDETVIIVLLDNKLSVINAKVLNEGSVNNTHIDVRKIVEHCIKHNASSVILSHNHPSGVALPSSADIHTTLKIKTTLQAIGIRLLDHIVVAGDDFVSMADSSYL